jgi:3D (Asp-Asp-Asp) domain-containing protein
MSKKFTISLLLCIVLMITIVTTTALTRDITIHNPAPDMTATILNEVVAYETEYVYNQNIPSTADPLTLVEGVNGLDYTYDGLTYTHLSDKVNEVVQVGTGAQGIFNGKLTGYGPDCPGCSLVGNVSCRTREGANHSLTTDGLYYTDTIYGSVRILAADHEAFPCGTIVKVNNGVLDEFMGIVLDTGYAMRNAWDQGTIWMDLAFSSQKEALTGGATSSNTKFEVQRWGW